jgi:hypothetical protein
VERTKIYVGQQDKEIVELKSEPHKQQHNIQIYPTTQTHRYLSFLLHTKTKMNSDSNKVTRVNIKLYASRLKNLAGAFHGTSDPFCIVTQLGSAPSELGTVLGRTEV